MMKLIMYTISTYIVASMTLMSDDRRKKELGGGQIIKRGELGL